MGPHGVKIPTVAAARGAGQTHSSPVITRFYWLHEEFFIIIIIIIILYKVAVKPAGETDRWWELDATR